ncbi:MAG: hypothetical protein ACTS3F_07805 [Phycisphaerales bacterium]
MPGEPATTIPSAHTAWRPGRSLRFALWVAPVALILASPLLPVVITSPGAEPLADATALSALTLMLLLLATTPADAIKLPRGVSWIIITLGTAWIVGMRRTSEWSNAIAGPIGTTGSTMFDAWLIGSLYAVIMLLAIGIVASAQHLITTLHPPKPHAMPVRSPHNPSPWRITLYAWHPAFPIVVLFIRGGVASPRAMVLIGIAAVAMLLAAIAADDAVRAAPRWRRPMALFLISGALIIGARVWL